ncbi:AhpC/TSA family protein [Chitinophaga sedimenti]|uniref:TlpA disulfide reductase family protein n=1 Tax=Chitinophaga sedimenti TaxID=2033606 RepID=UPI0020045A46|nr:TlpA disulfide reductase family protein [Chitinophaga sedimenti]MCK7557596.1 AhpC/TSA family protein [Chitinophaga sedimenti]
MKKIMKTTAIGALLMVPAALCAQQPFTIKGKLEAIPSGKVYLSYAVNKKQQKDSAVITQGAFTLKGSVAEPISAYLMLAGGRDMLTLYLEKGNIEVKGRDALRTATVKGGEVNTAYAQLKAQLAPSRGEKDENMEADRKAAIADFVKSHPNSVVSLNAIIDYGGFQPAASDLEPLYNTLAVAVKNTAQGQAMGATIARLKKSDIGQLAPVFTKTDPQGKSISLTDYRGKYVLLDFWASWCKPCRAENPYLVKAYEKYRTKNFEVLGVSLDVERGRTAWTNAIAEDKLTWAQVIDLGEEKASDMYNVQAIPQNYLIDPQGKIIARNLRGEELEAKLAEVLK